MKKIFGLILLAFAGCWIGVSCSSSASDSSVEPVKIVRFDEVVYGYDSLPDSAKLTVDSVYAPVASVMSKMYGVDSTGFIADYSRTRAVQIFEPDVKQRFLVADSLAEVLGEVRGRLNDTFGKDLFPAQVYGVIIPFNQSIIIADTLVLVGLNHYLGADYPGYESFESFRRRLKSSHRLVPDVAEAVVSVKYPYQGEAGATVLSRLLYEGAVLSAVKKATSGSTADLLGFTEQEYKWVHDNEAKIWQAMAANNLIYSTNPNDAARLIDPAPAATIINANAPGRVGRYIGLQIVESYLRNNEGVELGQLLSPDFYAGPESLIRSKYAPK